MLKSTETTINIHGTGNNISQTRQQVLASELYDFANCDVFEGANYRDCTITISRATDGNTGNLTIPGTLDLDIYWIDH